MAGEKEGGFEAGREGCGGWDSGREAAMRDSAAADSASVGSGSMSEEGLAVVLGA